MINNNFSEIRTLCEELAKSRIPYSVRPLFDGWQVFGDKFSVVCHELSMGGKRGLLEILFRDTDEVVGDLTACELLDLFEDDLR